MNIYTKQSVWERPSHPVYPAAMAQPPGYSQSIGGQPPFPPGQYDQGTQNAWGAHPTSPPPDVVSNITPAPGETLSTAPGNMPQPHPAGPPPDYQSGEQTSFPADKAHPPAEAEHPDHPDWKDNGSSQILGQHNALPSQAADVQPGEQVEGERGFLTDWMKKPHGSGFGAGPGPGAGRGFLASNAGKTAAGFGAGVLLGGVLEHAWDKHGHFGMGWGNNSVAQPQQNHHHGGMFGGVGSALFSGPPLRILSANYGGGDCTEKVRDQVRPNNTLEIDDGGDGGVYDRLFGDAWGGNPKSLLVLYQFGNKPMELLVTCQNGGSHRIGANEYVSPLRRAFVTECGPVVAVIWGIMENRSRPVPDHCIQKIANYESFGASNEFFGFNGWDGRWKTAVVFYRAGNEIRNMSIRQDGTGRLG